MGKIKKNKLLLQIKVEQLILVKIVEHINWLIAD